jgi:radical SAM superfamily enzyme YgiQ (UPF0313 family)
MSSEEKRVALISPLEESPPLEGFSRIMNLPRYGTTSVATAIRDAGYEVRVFSEYVRSEIDWDYVLDADYVCFGTLSSSSLKAYEMADLIKLKRQIPVIFGGSHASVLAEDCLGHCDYVVRNEGEAAVLELLKTLDDGRNVGDIKGISYKDEHGRIIHNPDREFMTDIDRVPDISLVENYRPISFMDNVRYYLRKKRFHVNAQILQTSRGCPNKCSFCFGRVELGSKYRMRSIESIIRDIKNKIKILKTTWFYVVDNEFTINRKRTRELLNRLIEEFGGRLQLLVFARIEICQDEELLELMKKAGVYRIYLGIESINDNSLKEYNKRQTLDDIKKSIRTIYSYGLEIFASLVLGSDQDTKQSIRDTFTFLVKYNVHAICVLSIYDFPYKEKTLGIPQVFPDNRFIHNDWRFYNGNFVIHYPKQMKPSTLQQELINGTRRFYSKMRRLKALFFKGKIDYFTQVYSLKPVLETMDKYMACLKKYEHGLYDENEILIEEKLPKNDQPELKRYLPI